MQRVRAAFGRVARRREAALIPYVVAGYPSMRASREILWQAFEAGANLIELGIPFSDPVADGPTIARATHRALARGTTPKKCLDLVSSLRKEGFDVPILGMTYANILFAPGYAEAARRWKGAGLDGAIVPDISLQDSGPFRAAFRAQGLGTTFFAAPSTPRPRLRRALSASTAFLYLVAVYGTTGARRDIAPETLGLLRQARRARGAGRPPLCVGFGVSRPAHVRALRAAKADGVIVGSALVDAVDAGVPIRHFLKQLKFATLAPS